MILSIKKKLEKDFHLAELLKGAGVAFAARVLTMAMGYFFSEKN